MLHQIWIIMENHKWNKSLYHNYIYTHTCYQSKGIILILIKNCIYWPIILPKNFILFKSFSILHLHGNYGKWCNFIEEFMVIDNICLCRFVLETSPLIYIFVCHRWYLSMPFWWTEKSCNSHQNLCIRASNEFSSIQRYFNPFHHTDTCM